MQRKSSIFVQLPKFNRQRREKEGGRKRKEGAFPYLSAGDEAMKGSLSLGPLNGTQIARIHKGTERQKEGRKSVPAMAPLHSSGLWVALQIHKELGGICERPSIGHGVDIFPQASESRQRCCTNMALFFLEARLLYLVLWYPNKTPILRQKQDSLCTQ